jgi:hypothetical protein
VIADLHTHSLHSDGLLTPAALAELAAARGVNMLALTDHDTVAGCDEFATTCASLQVIPIRGVELSCFWRGQTLHVLGLGIQSDHGALRTHLDDLLARRRLRLQTMAARLTRRCGLEVGRLAQDLAASTALPTRMHLARALVAAGLATDTGAAFREYLLRGRPGYAPSAWPELAGTLAVIAAAGGLAVLAHPQRYRLSAGGLRALVAEFAAGGGCALECSSGPTNPGTLTHLAALAAAHGLQLSAGSDFHDPANAWNTPGRFAKLPAGGAHLAARLASMHG